MPKRHNTSASHILLALKKQQSLVFISYLAYTTHGIAPIKRVLERYKTACVFPFSSKKQPVVAESDVILFPIAEIVDSYGTLGEVSKIYAFERLFELLLDDKLKEGAVVSTSLLAVHSLLNTFLSYPTLHYAMQSVPLANDLFVVVFEKT